MRKVVVLENGAGERARFEKIDGKCYIVCDKGYMTIPQAISVTPIELGQVRFEVTKELGNRIYRELIYEESSVVDIFTLD